MIIVVDAATGAVYSPGVLEFEEVANLGKGVILVGPGYVTTTTLSTTTGEGDPSTPSTPEGYSTEEPSSEEPPSTSSTTSHEEEEWEPPGHWHPPSTSSTTPEEPCSSEEPSTGEDVTGCPDIEDCVLGYEAVYAINSSTVSLWVGVGGPPDWECGVVQTCHYGGWVKWVWSPADGWWVVDDQAPTSLDDAMPGAGLHFGKLWCESDGEGRYSYRYEVTIQTSLGADPSFIAKSPIWTDDLCPDGVYSGGSGPAVPPFPDCDGRTYISWTVPVGYVTETP